MTRDEVLDVLDALSPLKRRKLDRADIPVLFMKNRIAVLLPAERYVADVRIKLDGKFQNTMTIRKQAHAFLDFVPEAQWKGQATTLEGGFS
ncbi:MAG: hypothetical protein JWM80_4017 [Cyanobacteria bacterium RYN_339]|nr:hypothetical protein [Cyanobacteria bacterium RYN_339]